MGVTRLERKGRKNKTVAKVRVATIKRLKSKITVESPNKEESGVVIGDVMEVLSSINSKPAAKTKKEAAPKAEKKAATASAPAQEASADKLTKIEGIGPKMAGVFTEAGVSTFKALSEKTPEELRAILDAAEGNYAAHNPGTWPEQAKMAAEGKWDELKKWQDELDGGK